jgi:predicted esterase
LTINEFVKFQKYIMDLALEKRFQEALVKIEQAKSQYTSKIDRLGHWKASIYCIIGETDKAIAELNEVLEKGLWWNPSILLSDTELAPLKELSAFKSIIENCESLYIENKKNCKMKLVVTGNEDAKTAITSLHWKGSNITDFAEQIGTREVLNQFLVSFVQSSQLFSHECFSWDDYKIAKKDVLESFTQLEEDYRLEGKSNVLLGASQGGALAINLCLDHSLPKVDKVIAVVPAIEDLTKLEEAVKNGNRSVKCCIITGDKDPYYENVLKAVEIFKNYNITCELIVEEGLGHALPTNFNKMLNDYVNL